MQAPDILAKFDGVQEEQEHYLARCPAHADRHPSLVIWFKESGLCTMTCRAGCKTENVIAAVGLRWSDLRGVTGDAVTAPAKRSALVSGAPVARLALYALESSKRLKEAPRALAYASRRFGVGPELAAELRLGYDPGEGFDFTGASYKRFPRLTVPLCDFRGVALGLQGRDITGRCPRRWLSLTNPEGMRWVPFGVFRPNAEVMVVTEGPGDGLTAVAANDRFGAVVIRGASLIKNPELADSIAGQLRGRTVIVTGDSDKAGRGFTATANAADGLRRFRIAPHTVEIPRRAGDLSDWFEKDPEFSRRFSERVTRSLAMAAKPNKAQYRRMTRMAAAFAARRRDT